MKWVHQHMSMLKLGVLLNRISAISDLRTFPVGSNAGGGLVEFDLFFGGS